MTQPPRPPIRLPLQRRTGRPRRPRGLAGALPEGGAALVEFALVLPVFALMLFAMVQFGLVFAGWAQLRNAVQTGARMASVGDLKNPPECGNLAATSCAWALLIGSPPGLSPVPVTSLEVPLEAGCDASLTQCRDYSWLDGYYIYEGGTWEQIVGPADAPPLGGQIGDAQALADATSGLVPWKCRHSQSTNCTELDTAGATDPLGQDAIAVSCGGQPGGSCGPGDKLTACATLMASPFTGFFPSVSVSTRSTFYMETGTTAGVNEAGTSCG
jgi:hypothetical protein